LSTLDGRPTTLDRAAYWLTSTAIIFMLVLLLPPRSPGDSLSPRLAT
jgi:hypothetical protein